ncbi:MAG: RNA-binding transcriptional accessory protein [Lachnospiraceae bacterium]|nr:RNA-binding transcriptional accessory protein [Lachnospiraceae bacterium]
MNINETIAKELDIKVSQVDATVKLIDEGNTIPFIARYRKEVTGSLNDEVLRNLHERLEYLRGLEERKATVLASIEEQGKLTDELKKKIEDAMTMVAVEDLYRPYKQKKKTRGSVAREKGLEPLALFILSQSATEPVLSEAEKYVNEEKDVKTPADAIAGAKDIIAEDVSDNADYRTYIREISFKEGKISSKAKDEKAESVYEMYYDFEEDIPKIVGHRVLALNRGEKEKILAVKTTAPKDKILAYLEKQIIKNANEYTTPLLKEAIEDSYDRLIAPSIERDIRNELTEKAEDGAISVFGKNLKQLLMQQPIAGKTVLGWDPAFRTGCKLAVVDPTGKVLATTVIFPTEPQKKIEESKAVLKKLIKQYNVDLISVGNGTASRESELVIVDLLKELDRPVSYVIVNEAGASVYSASKLATEEFPNFDVGQRSATSIARRLQDPLAELVKIDPQSIGVGQYQHDMNQKKLSDALLGVVEDSVNKVGVDLNTASAPLLEYISGVSKPIAKNIVEYRETNGKFTDRKQLLKVPKLGPKAFEQCAGFMRITGGDNPLDATSVHPESYEAVKQMMEKLGFTADDIREAQRVASENAKLVEKQEKSKDIKEKKVKDKPFVVRNTDSVFGQALANALNGSNISFDKGSDKKSNDKKNDAVVTGKETKLDRIIKEKAKDRKKLAEELGIGEITLNDIINELKKPARDPREDMPAPILRSDVLDMKDLKKGMVLKGTVRNVIDFGIFVDIGVHQDGLVHISQITDKYIKHPLDVVSVGDIVDVQVLDVDIPKKRISLTMKIKK